jgi:hypothetical protein
VPDFEFAISRRAAPKKGYRIPSGLYEFEDWLRHAQDDKLKKGPAR